MKSKKTFLKNFAILINFSILLTACGTIDSNNALSKTFNQVENNNQTNKNNFKTKLSQDDDKKNEKQPSRDDNLNKEENTSDIKNNKPNLDEKNLLKDGQNSKANEKNLNQGKKDLGKNKDAFNQFKKAGNISSLNVDHYFPVLEKLSKLINETTVLSTLTNDQLNTELKKAKEFSDLNIEIYNGSSEVSGTLKLKLMGKYLNQPVENIGSSITDQGSIITITGFLISNSEHLKMNSLKLNPEFFLNNLKTKKDFATFSNEQWKKYLIKSSFSYELANNQVKFTENFNSDNVSKRFAFDFKYNSSSSGGELTIQAKAIQRKFENNKWSEISDKTNDFKVIRENGLNSIFRINSPDKKTALDFFTKKIIRIDDVNRSKKFASYWRAKFLENALLYLSQLLKLDDKSINYLKNEYGIIKLGIKSKNVLANDFNGSLFLSFALIDVNEYDSRGPNNISSDFFETMKIEGFKKIESLNNSKVVQIASKIPEKNSHDKSNTFWNSIKRKIVIEYKKKNLTSVSNSFEIPNPHFSNSYDSLLIIKPIDSDNSASVDDNGKYFKALNEETNFKLLGRSLSGEAFSFDNNAFNIQNNANNQEGTFWIKSLRAEIKTTTKAKVVKNSVTYSYSFDFVYLLEIANSSSFNDDHATKKFEIPGKLEAFFQFSDIENSPPKVA